MTRYPNNEQRGDQHIDRHPDAAHNAAQFSVRTNTLTDKSKTYDVIATLSGRDEPADIFHAESEEQAGRIARGLNTCLSMLLNTDWTGPQ